MILTFLARVLDGLILVETWEQQGADQSSVSMHKQQAKQLLKKVRDGPHKLSVELDNKNFLFHYIIEDGVCFLTLCEKSFPRRLAFAFLDDIYRAFLEELKREFGTHTGIDYRSHIDTVEKPYYFIKFDRVIQQKKKEYADPSSVKAISKLNESLQEIQTVMQKNIEEMLYSEESLNKLGSQGQELKNVSKQFEKNATMLALQALAKKYGIIIGIVFICAIFFYVKFF